MENKESNPQENESIKKLQRALFYESQYRNAIVTDAICFYDANVTKDIIESDFFFRDDDDDFVSVPDYLGISTPCKFSDFINKWAEMMIPDPNQKNLKDLQIINQKLTEIYNQGKREYVINYWAENVNGKRIFFNQRFLLTRNEFGDICALSIIKDFTKLKEWDDEYLNNELEQYAFTDPITNGYNYIKFKEKLRDSGLSGSIICLDIHSFKTINSICGVTKGDEVIKTIWESILTALDLDKGDLAAHINADHYIIFIPSIDEKEIIRKIKNITLTLLVISVDLDVPQLHPYLGISKYAPGKKIELAYNESVIAKHNAKFQQDINYAFFNEEDTNRLIHEKEILDSFEDAMARKEFKIWLQPKYIPGGTKLVGAEALVRWIKPDGTMLFPDSFIPLFEKNNLIRSLDEYIFRNVCELQKKWIKEGAKIVPVSVNLSRASLYYKGVAEEYNRITEVLGVDPKYVPIEITETAAVSNEDVKEIIDKFHECGFSLQMDDFGSGYSSLASLNLMHFDTLKLDKSLIDYIGNFGGNRLIEHTICLAKELGISITAEGVETETQVQFLKHIGCDIIQGFFYSKPIPHQDFEKILLSPKKVKQIDITIDHVENHIFDFNQKFYKAPVYSLLVNFTKDEITDYTDASEWFNELQLQTKCYSEAVDKLINERITEEYKIAFGKFAKRESVLEYFSGVEETRILSYKRVIDEKEENIRVIQNMFKIQDCDDIWGYIKVVKS